MRAVTWGVWLWLIGYTLGIILFPVVPAAYLGWVIMPMGIAITLWVLVKKIVLTSFHQYFVLSLWWVAIAVVCDYLFLVLVFKPADGYYKLDVYVYYLLTFLLPVMAGWKTLQKK